MQAFKEASIPPFGVVLTYDGSVIGDMKSPSAWGTREQCAQWIADHIAPFACEFDIRDIDSGRLASYLCPVPSVRRRGRVLMSDADTTG